MKGLVRVKLLGFTDCGTGMLEHDGVDTLLDLSWINARFIQSHARGSVIETATSRTYYVANSLDDIQHQLMGQKA